MVFTIQRYIEDYLAQRGLNDLDQYAVRVANAYDSSRTGQTTDEFLSRMSRISTVIFKNARNLNRAEFEAQLLSRLDSKFKKKVDTSDSFPGGVSQEAKRLRRGRRSMRRILDEFQNAVESRGIDAFWNSRASNRLKQRPEAIAQALFAVFAKGALGNSGLVLREMGSGVGFVDFAIIFSTVPHLIEMKVLTRKFTGISQLAHYMRNERRRNAWLIVLDSRPVVARTEDAPTCVRLKEGRVRVVWVDINPVAPSRA